ncbi:MAG TPA: hypothetical protein VNN18_09575 [Candidatus Xenobia bacterium]|nr:hypothetical protein [Candidatus Xenobia bacterium]
MGDSSLFVPPPPPSPWPRRIVIATVLVLAVGALAYHQFRYYPEKRQVVRFLDALVAGDYPGAYQIWGPTPDYTYQDFLQDWGETTPIGRIRSYEIVSVGPPSEEVTISGKGTVRVGGRASGVVVVVRLNGTTEEVKLWVERKDKTLSFAPF